jgi:hypothetical protein
MRAPSVSGGVGHNLPQEAPLALANSAPRPATLREMIDGTHTIIYSRDPEADRAFLDTLLGLGSADAGGGWPIFALPPSEVAVHPDEHGGRQELYLLTPDLDALLAELEKKAIAIERPPRDERWGRVVTIRLPGGGPLGIYQPSHPRPER